MYTRHFFLRGRLVCTDQIGRIRVRETLTPPHGEAFFCPLCSEVWGLAIVEGQPTAVHTSICDRHSHSASDYGDWNFGHLSPWEVPGSFWLTYDAQWSDNLPLEILAREFLLLTKEYPHG